jgi:hypothetical protein
MIDRAYTEGMYNHLANANETGVVGKLFQWQTFFEIQ